LKTHHLIVSDVSAAGAAARTVLASGVAHLSPPVIIIKILASAAEERREIGRKRIERVVRVLETDRNPPLARGLVPDGAHDATRRPHEIGLALDVVARVGVRKLCDSAWVRILERRSHLVWCVLRDFFRN